MAWLSCLSPFFSSNLFSPSSRGLGISQMRAGYVLRLFVLSEALVVIENRGSILARLCLRDARPVRRGRIAAIPAVRAHRRGPHLGFTPRQRSAVRPGHPGGFASSGPFRTPGGRAAAARLEFRREGKVNKRPDRTGVLFPSRRERTKRNPADCIARGGTLVKVSESLEGSICSGSTFFRQKYMQTYNINNFLEYHDEGLSWHAAHLGILNVLFSDLDIFVIYICTLPSWHEATWTKFHFVVVVQLNNC